MFKNTIMYRRLWYARRRNARKLNIFFKLFLVLIILWLTVIYADNRLTPLLAEMSEQKARSMVSAVVTKVLDGPLSESFKYDELVRLYRDENGNIHSVETDMIKLNRLTEAVSGYVKLELDTAEDRGVSVPLGALTGIDLFTSVGPIVYVDIRSFGTVQTEFGSDFSSEGNNRTRHNIYFTVKAELVIKSLFFNERTVVSEKIPVADTVIVGGVPERYAR